MPKLSAALLLHRVRERAPLEVLIVHPGGPFWARKDEGAWSLPKGEYQQGEEPLTVARREFEEEVGVAAPQGHATQLGSIKQPSGKIVTAFAQRGDVDLSGFRSNTFDMEWPKGSGRLRQFPEVDKAEWVSITEAREKLLKGQRGFLDMLLEHVSREQV